MMTNMKKIFKSLAAGLAIVAAASCAKELAHDNLNETPDNVVSMTFGASIDSPTNPNDTKTILVDGLNVHWSEGDEIVVHRYKSGSTSYKYYTNSGYCYSFSINNSTISEGNASFEGSASDYAQYAAVYPYSSIDQNTQRTCYSFYENTLSQQTACIDNFPSTPWGTANISITPPTNKGDQFVFQNALAYFKFSVSNANVYSIELSVDKTMYLGTNNFGDAGNIGGTLCYDLAATAFYTRSDKPIILTNDGNCFVPGETYYLAIPSIKMEGLKLIGKDKTGAELFKLSKQNFTSERNTIYNLGFLDGSSLPIESLEVDKTTMSFADSKGYSTFTIVSNVDWTITSNQSWVNVDKSSGSATSSTIITVNVEANTSTSARSAQITIKGKQKTHVISVAQSGAQIAEPTYVLGGMVYPNEMVSGGKYVVLLRGHEYSNSVGNKYLKSRSDHKLTYGSMSSLKKENIFVFNKTADSDSSLSSLYSVSAVGTWTALNSGYTLQQRADGSLYFEENGSCEITIAKYGSGDSYYFDIFKKGTGEYLHYTGGDIRFGTSGWYGYYGNDNGNKVWVPLDENRQWYIYEVLEQ